MTDSTRLSLDPGPDRTRSLLGLALALSLGAAVSLGITRFAYGLLLPAMRADLGWSYTLAGAMNTVNALGYLRVMFAVDDIDDTLNRLARHGATLVSEVARYGHLYWLCYIRGPEGVLIGLAQPLGPEADRTDPMA